LSDKDLQRGTTFVGFFSSSCGRCATIAGELAGHPPHEPFVALVEGTEGAAATARLTSLLSAFARVAVVERSAPVLEAFAIEAFPTLLRVHNGVIVKAGGRPRELGLGGPLDQIGQR